MQLQINKMDDPSIINPDGTWSQERYKEIVTKLTTFLKTCGYRDKDVIFLPMSGLLGLNIKDPVAQKTCPWYQVELHHISLYAQQQRYLICAHFHVIHCKMMI